MKTAFSVLAVLFVFIACNEPANNAGNKEQASTEVIPQERSNPSSQPIAIYSENISSEMGRLNHWKFAVALYETNKTFMYRVQVQYAELNITDSLQFPDLGFMPKPALQKGKDEHSCIIGFMDNNNTFRDYKIVKETDGNVRIHTLKYYGVQPAAK